MKVSILSGTAKKTQWENHGKNGVAVISGFDYEGRGVARLDGKTVFVSGALPAEKVHFRTTSQKKQFFVAETVKIVNASGERIEPACSYFQSCGGCVLQHVSHRAQVALKQRIMEEQLERIGKVVPQTILPPIYGTPWHYRDRARLSVETDEKGRLKLGFQAKKSHTVINIDSCMLLPEYISEHIPATRELLQKLHHAGQKIRFVEFFNGSQAVLNIGLQKPLPKQPASDLIKWFEAGFGKTVHDWQLWVQPHNREAAPLYPANGLPPSYALEEFGIVMPYRPGDFTQINAQMNAVMVARALRLLDIRQGDRIADLFCGLGNFSLPMAQRGAKVTGIEGAEHLVQRAKQNAEANGCAGQTEFFMADLFDTDKKTVASWGVFDKMLIDPPRSGAYEVVKSLHPPYLPKKIVYVSCNPSTFARDAGVLVEKGYIFKAAGVMNMFAQTSHVESIGVFELP